MENCCVESRKLEKGRRKTKEKKEKRVKSFNELQTEEWKHKIKAFFLLTTKQKEILDKL